SSAFCSLPLFKQILDSDQFELVCISVQETLGFELTHEARRTDLGNAGCQSQFGCVAKLSPRSAQEPRLDVLGQDYLEHPLSKIREERVGRRFRNSASSLVDFRGRAIKRFETWSAELSESAIVEEPDGNVWRIAAVKS